MRPRLMRITVAAVFVATAVALVGCGGGGGGSETVTVEVTAEDPEPSDAEASSVWCESTDESDQLNLAQARWFDAYAADDYAAMSVELDAMLGAAITAPPRTHCVVITLNVAVDEAAAIQADDLVERIRAWQDAHDQRTVLE